jgi:alkanesulfonate monooxygenase SsuD/methylene tetrahydromethanopterin reductase-like flavin-dependent oxidoreductase (luciferase family)
MLDEATTIIRGLLTQERTSFKGKHFSVDNASCLPLPIQDRLPIWLGGLGEKKTLKLVAKHADGWNAAYTSVENFTRLSSVLDTWCDKLDRDPTTLQRSINLMFHLGTSQTEVDAEREKLATAWGPAARRVEGGALLCTPTEAVDRINAYKEAGADMINIALRAPWNEDALNAYLDEVIPTVKG